ncbi:MAG: hypothetical protein ACFFHV_07585 [Promethearchaeota archaeon]
MNKIDWIYIIDDTGATIFSYEIHVQGSGNVSHALLSHFLFALQSIGKNLKDSEIKSIEMSNNKFLLSKEKTTHNLFILKSNRDADPQLIKTLLKQIQDKFVKKFFGYKKLYADDKIELLNSFKEDIREILKEKTNIEKFSETL